jgi:hypothetical protein
MADQPASAVDRLELAAVILTSSVLGAPLVIAGAAPLLLGARANWLIVAATFALAFTGALVAIGIVLARLARRPDARRILRVPYVILGVQLVFGVLAGGVFFLSVIQSAR